MERPRRGPLFARNVAVEALARSRNTKEWKRWKEIIGGVQWGNTAIHFVAALPSWASLPQRSLTRSSFVVDRLNSNGFAKLVQDVNRLIVQFLRLGDICGEQPSRGQGAQAFCQRLRGTEWAKQGLRFPQQGFCLPRSI